MLIHIDVAAYYDWEEVPAAEAESLRKDEAKLSAEFTALRMKSSQNGGILRKVLVEQPSTTTIGMPESEIAYCTEHFERVGSPKSRGQLVAWYLAEKTMPHHAHASHFRKIIVESEPDVEKFLNSYFSTGSEA